VFLRGLKLQDFRAYRSASVSVPTHGLILVAGANNSGKSALLSALDVVAGSKQPAAVQHAAASEPARVLARFALSEEERGQLLASVHDGAVRESDALTWLEWQFIQVGDALVPLELHTSWPGKSDIPLARIDLDGQLWVSNAVLALQGMSDQGPELTARGAVGIQAIEAALVGRVPELTPVERFLADWRLRYYHFEPLRPGMSSRTQGLSTPTRLVPTGENLPGVLLHLQTNRFAVWERIRELIAQIVPDVGRLDTPTNEGNQIEVTFADSHLPLHGDEPAYRHNIKELGTGVEQLLMTIVVGVTQPAPSVVVIEEPETNLHAGAQRALLALLRQWATNRLFVAATHSSVFLDRTPGDTALYLVRRAKGASSVEPIEDNPVEALSELGIRFSDLLGAERLLLVEGPSDRKVLAQWFPNRMLDPRVAVVEAQGGDDARLVDRFDAWLKALDQLGRPVLFLRDRDELPQRLLGRLEASSLVHVLRRRELENYLLDPAAIAKVFLEREPPVVVQQDRVLAALREAAEELKPIVVMKRVAWELEPILPVDHTLRDQLAHQRATLEQFQAAVLERLPSPDEYRRKIVDLWANAEAAVNDVWEERSLELAPGEDVLKRAWVALGTAYDKQVDGPAIAAAMSEPPQELKQLVEDFLNER
jgi:predicted ATPase